MNTKSWMSPEDIDENYQQLMNSLKHCEEFIELKVRKSDIQEKLFRLGAAIAKEYEEYVEDLPELENKIAEANAVAKILSARLMQQNQLLLKHAVNNMKTKVQQSTQEVQQIVELFTGDSPHPSHKLLPAISVTNEKNQQIFKQSCFLTPNKNLPLPVELNSLHKLVLTGSNKISINQYKGSPLVKRKLRTPLKFSEFDVELKQHHFDKIPKYLRGRETLADLNQFVEQNIVPCFNEKYQLLYRERASIRHPNDLELWKMRYVAAYLLAVLGGLENPKNADLEKILSSVGIEVDSERLTTVVKELTGKSIPELIKSGREKLSSMPVGGAVAAAPAAGAPAAAAAGGDDKKAAKEEKKEESESEDDDMGFALFD